MEERLQMDSDRDNNENLSHVKIYENLQEDEREEIRNLLQRYKKVFSNSPGKISNIKHRIDLTNDTPVYIKPYPLPHSIREEIKDDINKLKLEGVIRESTSPYASPLVIAKKKDGSRRLCPDYRKLNKITIFDPEPMNNAEDLLPKMQSAKIFSNIDLSK